MRAFHAPDVAAAKVRPVYASGHDFPLEEAEERMPLYVMAKEAGAWLLTACQNTAVATREDST